MQNVGSSMLSFSILIVTVVLQKQVAFVTKSLHQSIILWTKAIYLQLCFCHANFMPSIWHTTAWQIVDAIFLYKV